MATSGHHGSGGLPCWLTKAGANAVASGFILPCESCESSGETLMYWFGCESRSGPVGAVSIASAGLFSLFGTRVAEF